LGDGIKVIYDTEKPIMNKLRKVNDILLWFGWYIMYQY
jgi:hypothetical protein